MFNRLTAIRLIVPLVLVLSALGIMIPTTLAAGVCPTNQGDLQSLITAGGTITFDCPSNTIIPFSSLITINNTVTLDASTSPGTVTFNGQGVTSLLKVTSSGNLTIDRLTFTGGGANNDGGAVSTYGGSVTITDSTFTGNHAISTFKVGGALAADGGTLTVSNSTFTDNNAWQGGAISNYFGSVNVSNSSFSGNVSQEGGAILTYGNNPSQSLTVSNSTFSQNTGLSDGGGITTYHTPTTIRNSTFANNSSALYLAVNAPTTLLNNTFAGNSGSFVPIYAYGSPLTVGGNIFDNSGGACFTSSVVNLGYNLDPSGSCTNGRTGTGDIGGDPMLGPLADNGGPTLTMALLDGSPANNHIPTSYTYIDSNASSVPLCPSTDQRGFTRPGDGGTFCDVGAFESAGGVADTTPPVITPNVSGTLGNNDWYTSDVAVSWSVVDDESTISSTSGCDSTTINTDTTGTTLTCSATSDGGTNEESVTIMRDATAPTLAPTVSPNPVLLNGSASASPNANDATSGVDSSSCGTVDTSSVGAKSVSCSATDNAGNQASASASYTVAYQFAGFSIPIENGELNVAKAGQSVPLKWRLTDANQAPVTTLSSVRVTAVSLTCTVGTTADQPVESAAGAAGLQNLGNGYYQFNWSTLKSYAGSCKTLRLNLGEGSSTAPVFHTADFEFTR